MRKGGTMLDWFKPLEKVAELGDSQLVTLDKEFDKHITIVRWVSRALLLIIVVGMFWSMKSTVENIDSDAVAVAAEKQAAVILPQLQTAALEVGEEVAPSVAKALQAEASKVVDDLQVSMDKEIAEMEKGLPEKMEAAMLKEMGKARASQRAVLLKKYPALSKDPKKIEKLFAAFESGTNRWAGLVLVRLFEKHLEELNKLRATLNSFVAKKTKEDVKAGSAEPQVDGEQVLNLWLEILGETFGGEESSILPGATK